MSDDTETQSATGRAVPLPVERDGATVQGGSGTMFDAIARRYDLLNRLMSMGMDVRWRKKAVRALSVPAGGKILDVATGTGDVALTILKKHPDASVIGVDPSAGMLAAGRAKHAVQRWGEQLLLMEGDAQALPFDDANFDGVTIAFGIRNVPDRLRGLREMARVTKPGGRVVVLELTEPRGKLLGRLARFHIHTVIPRLGAFLSGAPEYRYLQASIAAFPPAGEFVEVMREARLREVTATPMSFGAVHLFVGTR